VRKALSKLKETLKRKIQVMVITDRLSGRVSLEVREFAWSIDEENAEISCTTCPISNLESGNNTDSNFEKN
jgi:hypothetical protein